MPEERGEVRRDGAGYRVGAATAAREIAELRELKKGADGRISRSDPAAAARRRICAGLHGGTGGERDHFIMAPR